VRARALASFALLAGGVACSGSGSGSAGSGGGGGGATSLLCAPGRQIACVCFDGRPGDQVCAADGQSYGACTCTGPSGGGGPGGSGGTGGGGGGGGAGAGDVGGGKPVAPSWALVLGSAAGGQARSVASDSQGNAIVGGYFGGSIVLGADTFTCSSNSPVGCGFVAKIDPSGTILWGRPFLAENGFSMLTSVNVAVGPNDAVFVGGGFDAAYDFGTGTIGGDSQYAAGYLVTISANGDVTNVVHYTAESVGGAPSVTGIRPRPNGGVVLTGQLNAGVDFGTGIVHGGVYVVDLAPNGFPNWVRAYNGQTAQSSSHVGGQSLELDAAGNAYFTGTYVSSGFASVCGLDSSKPTFVAEIDTTGTCVGGASFGVTGRDPILARDANDGTLILGAEFESGSIEVAGHALTPPPNGHAVFVVKLDAAFAPIWGDAYPGNVDLEAWGLAVDPTSGDVAVTGFTDGKINLGGADLPNPGDVLVATYRKDGVPIWSARYGDTAQSSGIGLAYAPGGRLLLTGSIQGTILFGAHQIQPAGTSDSFVASFSPVP
jgi:hypothetical protein